MSDLDIEILALRHLEGLTTAEAARELEISESTARKRYNRALEKLGKVLQGLEGDLLAP